MKTLKNILASALLIILPAFSFAQTQQDILLSEEPGVMVTSEKMPEYPGGQEAMMKFLSKNIQYPASALENNKQGVVYVQFVVDIDGSITNTKVIRGFDADCDAEALRVVNLMPNWTPGEQDGKKVKVRFNLPIRFALN